MRTKKMQIGLRIRAVWSESLIYASEIIVDATSRIPCVTYAQELVWVSSFKCQKE